MSTREDDRPGESFLGRWSRLKQETRTEEAAAPPPAPPARDEPKPELPPVESLQFESNFKDFLHPEVDEDLRRSALRKLFQDDYFNVIDPLDIYIDDYGKPDPIPPEMLKSLTHAGRALGIFPEESAGTEGVAEDVRAPAEDEGRAQGESSSTGDEVAGEVQPPAQGEGGVLEVPTPSGEPRTELDSLSRNDRFR